MHIHKSNSHSPQNIETESEKARKAKLAKRIYAATYAIVLLLLFTLLRSGPDWCFWLTLVMFNDSPKHIATLACRLAGVSQESRHDEAIQRDARAILAPLLSEAPAFSIGKAERPRLRLSREGIEHFDRKGKPSLIAWGDVESCTFATTQGVYGEHNGDSMALRGRDGKTLFETRLLPQQAEPLRAAMRFYLQGEGIREEPAST